MKNLIIITITSLLLSSCTPIMSKLYGIKYFNTIETDKIEEFYQSIDFKGIKITKKYSTDNYYENIKTDIQIDTLIKKELRQPIQLWYYNEKNEIIFSRINCNVPGGLSSLKWNYDEAFNSFPPNNFEKITDYEKYSKYLNTYINTTNNNKVLVLWTRFLEKQSYKAINQIINNIENQKNIELILVNLDAEFTDMK